MTENLLHKLEERTMMLLSELEILRKEVHLLKHENAVLKSEKENSFSKLQDLISVLDTVSVADPVPVTNQVRLQSREEYAA